MNGKLSPLLPARLILTPLEEFCAKFSGAKFGNPTREDLVRSHEELQRQEIFKNEEYQVNVRKGCEHGFGDGVVIWHLSIKRLDKAPVHDWRDLQAIKNQICGESTEAMELYPSERRLVDTANQYHLYAFMHDGDRPSPMIPIGWQERLVLGAADAEGTNARQRDR